MSNAATIAIAGNPNAGKTTLFNSLTGARQRVGNYPGVTVEKKEGVCRFESFEFNIVDLPGTYSLTAYSPEELAARNFLAEEKPRTVVNIVDASNLERNLYLTVQLLEMGVDVCIALNMMDVAKKRGIDINAGLLAEKMGIDVVPMVARSGKGKVRLINNLSTARKSKTKPLEISYGTDIDEVLASMQSDIKAARLCTNSWPARWTALKYIEKDEEVVKRGQSQNPALSKKLEGMVEKLEQHLQKTLNMSSEAVIADYRYGYIRSILIDGVVSANEQQRLHMSDRIDMVLTNRVAGPLIMLAVIYGLYQFTFVGSETPVAWLESLIGFISQGAETVLPEGLFKSLIISGIIDGIGGVLGFAPLIMFMFFGISALEDSGYMARVAFMLDRVFRVFGLHGNSVMAFITSGGIAGGCAVPGVMAARTLKSPKERLATLLTVPFMNCGAKIPVFALLVAAFFPNNPARTMFIITLIAWSGALLTAKLLRSTLLKGETTPFVMELPPYRIPTLKGLLIHTWERTWQYIKKAGTVILGITILLWAMMTFPSLPEKTVQEFDAQKAGLLAGVSSPVLAELENPEGELSDTAAGIQEQLETIDLEMSQQALAYSYAGKIGRTLEPVSSLAGFDWRTNIALIGGFAAKEVVVSALSTAYSMGEIDPEESESLAQTLSKDSKWNPAVAWSLIIFTIFYAPCFVAVVCIAREAGSWKWGLFSMVFNTAIALVLSIGTYQIGKLLGY